MSEPHSGNEETHNDAWIGEQSPDPARVADTVPGESTGQNAEASTGPDHGGVLQQPQSGQLDSQDLESIRAKNVTMKQSGAEHIDAETVTIANGGAKSIKAMNVEMHNSGAMTITGDHVTMTNSSAMLVAGQNLELGTAGVLGIQAETITITGDSGSGLLIAQTVTAEKSVRALVGVIGNVKAGTKVELLFDAKSALALGAGFAIVFRLIGRLFNR
ncbi:MAG: hypothetical protein WKF81_07990 [Thermomicrobiales bacterium]